MYQPLAREIYGREPWCVDSSTFVAFINMLQDFRNGVKFEADGDEKLNSTFLYNVKSATRIVRSTYSLNNNEENDPLVYVINLNGAITKSGGMSSYGTKDLAQQLAKFDADKNVIGGIILTDSGGGSVAGMNIMNYAITQAKKPIVGLIERGGMAASAAYGILSHTSHIMSEAENNVVGSIGTMMSFVGHADKAIDGDGAKHVTVYATASTKKNKAFEEALNNDNYSLIISEILDPANEIFMKTIKANRPNVLESHLDGSTYNAGDVIGTLVDSIGDFSAAVNRVKELSAKKLTIKNKNTAMTTAELKAQHPNTYNEILGIGMAAGVDAERDRTGSWMAHLSTDPETVKKGIESGKDISSTARETLLVKANANAKLGALQKDSAGKLIVPESTTSEVEATEADAFYAPILAKLIKK